MTQSMSSTQATDAELVEEARSDERAPRRAAQRALYERYRGELFSLLVRLLQDRSAAEDLLQETFLRAFQRLDQQQDGRSFRGWLHRIGRNAAIDHLNAAAKELPRYERAKRAREPRRDVAVHERAAEEDEEEADGHAKRVTRLSISQGGRLKAPERRAAWPS